MIEIKGTKSSWGLVAKLFHWSLALLLFWQVATGISLHNMEFSPLKICLLYTSPSPRDKTVSRMPSSA